MTTIVCDSKTMVGDGRITANNTVITDNCIKVHKLKDGRIVGVAGDTHNWKDVLDYFDGITDKWPECSADFAAVVLGKDGKALVYDERGRPWERPLPVAIGSGRSFAYGALDSGSDVEYAVKVACKRDIYSGGILTKISLDV